MRVLVIGSGAREHALVARLSADPDVRDLLCAPGNPGIARRVRTVPIDVGDVEAAAALASRERVDLTVVGPELPLGNGIADRFARDGRTLFGRRPPPRASRRARRSRSS